MKLWFNKTIAVLLCASMLLSFGCINTSPKYSADITPVPTAAPTAVPTPEPTPEVTAEPTATPAPTQPPTNAVDALGAPITGSEHFIRYITFANMVVYEQGGSTFLDGIVNNAYPEPIVCAVSIVYYDEEGMVIASAQLQTRDGQYLLVLEPGETVVFANILTDMSLVKLEYKLEFDMSTGVHPR